MMMTDSLEGETSNGDGSSKQEAAYANALAYDRALTYAHLRAYVVLAMKPSGLLALLLSTVILLGGYVQSLGKDDFFCILAITVIQAAGIFQDWVTNSQYLLVFGEMYTSASSILSYHFCALLALVVLVWPFLVLVLCVYLFYLLGPLACAGISSWRIAKLNQGNNRDANMMAALNMFYSLIIFQGAMSLVVLLPMNIYHANLVRRLHSLLQLSEKWGKEAIRRYISDISAKCRKDQLSIKGRDLIKYGAELLDSESQEDYLYGARLLGAFVNKGEDVSWLLLPSSHRIQRLLDSLKISSSTRRLDEACVQLKSQSRSGRCYAVIGGLNDKREIRELAATIVAGVAADIDDISKYPGAMRCISSLLQDQEVTTQTYRNRNSKQVPDDLPQHRRPVGPLIIRENIGQERHMNLMIHQKRMAIKEHRHWSKREGGTSNKLVQQGLIILERLASNSDDNRRIICGAPGLLPKIAAPVYSATLIEDVKTKPWAHIVTRCLKVLYQLIRAPGRPGRRLRRQIFSNVQALGNLKSILLDQQRYQSYHDEADHRERQLVAMKILTELAMDPSVNLTEETKEVLVRKQLDLFLIANEEAAGSAMVSLSNSESNSALIMTIYTGIISYLTELLDDVLIMRRIIAAEIMANLCAHCNVDNTMKGILLPKVFIKIMSAGQNILRARDPGLSVPTENEERHNIYRVLRLLTSSTRKEEIYDQEREEQEAFLSLAQVICDKLNGADLDDAIQKAFRIVGNTPSNAEPRQLLRREAFVLMLKIMIDNNRHATADSLRIVKLCGQIAKSVMRCEQYVEIFINKGFKSSLSKASETMSELESCMLFVGTDFGLKKTVRPLFSEIEKSFGEK